MPSLSGKRNFLHVNDAARLMIAAADSKLEGYWPVCHPASMHLQEVAEIAYQVFGKGGQVIIDNTKVPFREFQFPNVPGLYQLLGCSPAISVSDGLQMILDCGHAGQFGPLDVK